MPQSPCLSFQFKDASPQRVEFLFNVRVRQWVVAVCKFEGNFCPISWPQRLECSWKHESLFHSHVPPFVVDEVVHSVVRNLAHKILIVQDSLHDLPDAAQTPCTLLMLGFETTDARGGAGIT